MVCSGIGSDVVVGCDFGIVLVNGGGIRGYTGWMMLLVGDEDWRMEVLIYMVVG